MPSYVLWTGTVNTTARVEQSYMTIHVNADSDVSHELAGEVDGDDAALAALAARDRVLRCEVDVDLGGGWETVPAGEVRVTSIEEDIEDWSDRCSLELVGRRWNPLLTGAMRGQLPVRVRLVTGDPSNPVTRTRFTGYITVPPYDRASRVASVTALDEASVHAETRVAPYILPSDNETRDDYLVDLLTANSVPITSIDLGANGSAAIVKPVSQFDIRLFDFVRDWISPCGAWLRFRDGGVHIFRYSSDMPVARVLTPSDIISIQPLTPPPSATPTKITAVTVNYDKVNTSGFRTLYFTETTTESYAVKGAVNKQDKTTGNITSVSYSDAAASSRKTREVRYRQTFWGDLLMSSDVIEYGWYARQMARLQVETDGTTVNHWDGNDAYQYEDGSWYIDKREKWGPLRHTRIKKTIVDRLVTRIVEERFFYGFKGVALFEMQNPGPAENFNSASPIGITEQGLGVDPVWEMPLGPLGRLDSATGGPFPAGERITVDYTVDDDGFLVSEVETVEAVSRGARSSSQRAGSFVYGFDDGAKEYWTDELESLQTIATRTVTYSRVDDETYLVNETLTETATNKRTSKPTVQGRGARPRPEQVTDQSRSQEIRQSATDEVRESLNGTIEDWISNEYCQDADDLLILANARLREESAWPIAITMPLDHTLRVGHYVEIDGYAEDGLDGLRLLVAGVALDLAGCTMSLRCRYYPPEVADA